MNNSLKREQIRRENMRQANTAMGRQFAVSNNLVGQADKLTMRFDGIDIVIHAVQGPDNEPVLKVESRSVGATR